MDKYLFYGMTGNKMCFNHILLNALDLVDNGVEAKIIFEGESVKLVSVFEEEKNTLYLKAKERGLIAGICLACSKVMGVFEKNSGYGLPMLGDMSGHAGMRPFTREGYLVISM
jgi:hypothetical protein